MINVAAYGELMLRLTVPDKNSFLSLPGHLESTFGGAEANFLANITGLGGKSYFISALPDNPPGNAARAFLKKSSINTQYVKKTTAGRMGIYYVEEGAASRPSVVTYDRSRSPVSLIKFEKYRFQEVFSKCSHFHLSGITPGLSETAMQNSIHAVRLAKEMGLTVSCDLNYRSKLWNYSIRDKKVDPEIIMEELVTYCDYLFGNESDVENFFKIEIPKRDYLLQNDEWVYYENILLQTSKRFPKLKAIALSIRDSFSAGNNSMGAVLYKRETNQFFFSPNIDSRWIKEPVDSVIDRIGTGDAFSSAFIFGLNLFDNLQEVLDFALASSLLKHTYKGDFTYADRNSVIRLMKGDKNGRIKR